MIKLLVVDDSALMRRLLDRVFTQQGDFQLAFAANGVEALERLRAFRPDVVTLDVHMPEMDGLACLDRIMLVRPCPVVMVSSLTEAGAEETLEAMQLGARRISSPSPKARSRSRWTSWHRSWSTRCARRRRRGCAVPAPGRAGPTADRA